MCVCVVVRLDEVEWVVCVRVCVCVCVCVCAWGGMQCRQMLLEVRGDVLQARAWEGEEAVTCNASRPVILVGPMRCGTTIGAGRT